jgi:hypothetical protein
VQDKEAAFRKLREIVTSPNAANVQSKKEWMGESGARPRLKKIKKRASEFSTRRSTAK